MEFGQTQNNFGGQPGLRVTKMLIHETGTYEDQWRRPYQTSLTKGTLDSLEERLAGTPQVAPAMVSDIAGQFIAPQAQPEKRIEIAHGWSERRLRFAMEVEYTYGGMGTGVTELLLGFTDYNGVNLSGAVDPQMTFYINSTLHVRQVPTPGPMGVQMTATIADNSHVLANNAFTDVFTPERDQRLRPTDIYSAMSRTMLDGVSGGDLVDTRTTNTTMPVKSRRANGMAAAYMSSVLQNYMSASASSAFGVGEDQILNQARGLAKEELASRDPFMHAMYQVTSKPLSNNFTWGDLLRLDPYVEQVVEVRFAGPAQGQLHQAGLGHSWQGADGITQAATILSQSVPALLMEHGLTKAVFKSSNYDFGGMIRTWPGPMRSFSNIDIAPMIQSFIIRLENEIIMGLTYGNRISFAIEMEVDLVGETKITIEMDGSGEYRFVSPSFCDALMVPVVTGNDQQLMQIATDFDNMLNSVMDRGNMPSNQGGLDGPFGRL